LCGFNEKGAVQTKTAAALTFFSTILLCAAGCARLAPGMKHGFEHYTLDFQTPVDAALQAEVEGTDARLRAKYGMTAEQTAVGVLDLRRLRLAMIHPDRMEYAASVPKIGILLAWFELHPEAARNLDAQTRHELGLMIKESNNEMATKFSRQMGLRRIQEVLNTYQFYDKNHGGGLWMGKHYGKGDERIGDPIANLSHAATVRQLLRFYLLLEQGKLVSAEASKTMREIFASPELPHREDKFVKGLAGRGVQVLRKAGWWETWAHDTAVVQGPGRHYILVAMTHHPKGDEYLMELARAVDEWMANAVR
jgi:beta-lactamase class A